MTTFRRPPESVTILVDNREKYPLLFPKRFLWTPPRAVADGKRTANRRRNLKAIRVVTKRVHLETGDYLLEEDPAGCVVERKGSIQELVQNFLTKDRVRALTAFRRLADSAREPVLLLDGTVSSLYAKGDPKQDHTRARAELLWLVRTLGIRLVLAGWAKRPASRRRLGEFVTEMMVQSWLTPQ